MFTLIIEDKHGAVADEYSFEEGEFVIGRSQGCDIILPSDNVSRRHARIYTSGGKCFIEDLQSSNGVYVNGKRLSEAYEIRRSATIRVGDFFLHVEGAPEEEGAAEELYGRLAGRNLSVSGKSFPIVKTVNLIGRGKDCTVTVVDPSVSRIHAKVTVDRQQGISVEDLRSSNGTFVNGERVERAALANGDLLRIGNVEFQVQIEGRSAPGRPVEAPPVVEAPEMEELAPRPRTGLIVGVVGAGLLVIGGVVTLLVVGRGSSGSESDKPADASAVAAKPVEPPKPAGPDIATLIAGAKDHEGRKEWEQARDRYQKALDLSPVDQAASQGFNRATLEMKHRDALAAARKALAEGRHDAAAPAAREIPESSAYAADAKALVEELKGAKGKLVEEATAACKKRRWEECAEKYRVAIVIDPEDAEARTKYFEAKRKAKH